MSTASAARGTHSVHVRTIGDSSSPSSFTCVEPASLPKPFPTTTAAGTFSRNMLPACGRIAVTPVLIESPRVTVVWPTRTPSTSVMASSGPGGRTPTTRPMSRALGRGVWLASGALARVRSRRLRIVDCGLRIGRASSCHESSRLDRTGSDPIRNPQSTIRNGFASVARVRSASYHAPRTSAL